MSSRILGTRVPAHFPPDGSVSVMIFGEAPGPRGADKSRIPFFGDRAGLPVYEALVAAGRCVLPAPVGELEWDGAALRRERITPMMVDTALSNAYPVCPTDDGETFRAPTRAELTSATNVRRLKRELAEARERGLSTIVVLGKAADWMLGTHLGLRAGTDVGYHDIIHPSPLGLLNLKRREGRPDMRMADLQQLWMDKFRLLLPAVAAGAQVGGGGRPRRTANRRSRTD